MKPLFRLLFLAVSFSFFACNSESGQTAQDSETEETPAEYVDSTGVLVVDYAKKAENEAKAAAEADKKPVPVEAISLKPEEKSGVTAFQEYTGTGNEPNWNLQIKPSGIVWFLMGQERETFPYRKPKDDGDAIIFTTEISEEEKGLRIRISKETCSDTMSDEVFPFKCEVNYFGRDYTGCAK